MQTKADEKLMPVKGTDAGAPVRRAKLAVVGCGAVAFAQHLPNMLRSERIVLHACCERDAQAARRVEQTFAPGYVTADLDTLLGDSAIDGIVLATRHEGRYELLARCAEAGKPLLVEKPLAKTLEECRRILELARRTGVALAVNYNRRCAPAALFARDVALRHRINPRSAPWRFVRAGQPEFDPDGRELLLYRVNDDRASFQPGFMDPATGGGSIRSEGCHFLDFAHWFLDRRPTRVTAVGNHAGLLSANLEFGDDALAVIVTAADGSTGYPKELIEYCGFGAAVINQHFVEVDVAGVPGREGRHTFPLPPTPFYVETPDAREPPFAGPAAACRGVQDFLDLSRAAQQWAEASGAQLGGVYFPDKGHFAMMEAFAGACLTGGPVPAGVLDGYRAALLVEKTVRAVDGGAPQTITEEEWNV